MANNISLPSQQNNRRSALSAAKTLEMPNINISNQGRLTPRLATTNILNDESEPWKLNRYEAYESSSEKSHDYNSYLNDSERKPALKSGSGSSRERKKMKEEGSLSSTDLNFMTAVSRIKNIMNDK